MSAPRSLHVVSSLNLSAGGPTQSVTRLCEALNQMGAYAEIATVQAPGEVPIEPLGVPVHKFPIGPLARLRRSSELAAFLRRNASRFDLIHVHGLWEWPGVYARRAAIHHGIPLVISPRGMLEPWSLRQNAALKGLALALWERRNLRAAALLHATSEPEAGQFLTLGLRSPIAVVANGLEFPASDNPPRDAEPIVLFLSRFHPKKGVDLLLKAWADMPFRSAWRLILAGPDPDGYRAHLEVLTSELGLQAQVTFLGPQYGEDKWSLIRQSRLFVLPSHSENFGNVVPEALSQGIPVIATQGTPWQGLEAHGCGWWAPTSAQGLREALNAALGLPPGILTAMGQRGITWARSTFSAEATTRQMLRHYRDLSSTAAAND